MDLTRAFASDNNAGVHPRVMEALIHANQGHVAGYGHDPFTARAEDKFHKEFGESSAVFFVFNGTAANVLGLKTTADSFNAVVCATQAHLNQHECAAPEKHLGCKLLTLPAPHGKLRLGDIEAALPSESDEHVARPSVVSMTQATELGTLYRPEETRAIAALAHRHGLHVHMDGSRITNAAAAQGLSLRQATADLGVDVLSFGGTKNGLMFGEAVVFFNAALAKNFLFIRKQGLQLGAKQRFIAAQFEAYLTDELWRQTAGHANRMARELAETLRALKRVEIVEEVETNVVFARLPKDRIKRIQARRRFYTWDEHTGVVRLMTAFDTTPEDIQAFAQILREEL